MPFKLCDLKATAGAILQHAIGVTLALFRREEPLIFKFGFTHNPIWRWTSPIYGYATARERWSNMLILHYAPEPYSPAMLEAALIEKFNSNSLDKHQHVFLFFGSYGCYTFFEYHHIHRNIKERASVPMQQPR